MTRPDPTAVDLPDNRSFLPPARLPISIVIATFNRGSSLLDTLSHLSAIRDSDCEIIVVDQTEAYDPEVELQIEGFESIGLIRRVRPRVANLPFARNVGIRLAQHDIVLFCDDDIQPSPTLLTAYRTRFADPTVAAVAGRVVSPIDELLSHSSGLVGRLKRNGYVIGNFHTERAQEVDFGMGCNMAFRRAVLARIGGFDERYSGNFLREEGDAFARIRRLGYRVVFEPTASVVHLVEPAGGCRQDDSPTRMISSFRNEGLFVFNCLPTSHKLLAIARLIRSALGTTRARRLPLKHVTILLRALAGGISVHYKGTLDTVWNSETSRDPEWFKKMTMEQGNGRESQGGTMERDV